MSSFFGSPKIGIKLDDRPETVLKLYNQTKLESDETVTQHNIEIDRIQQTINKHIVLFDLVVEQIVNINIALKEKSTALSENNVVKKIDVLAEIISVLQSMPTKLSTNDIEVVSHLYYINAFYEEFVHTPNNKISGYYEIAVFPTFRENYETYREGIVRFVGKTPISIVANMDVLKEQDISKLRDKTVAIIEKVYTRIMFYQYSTIHNHYLSILYMMYAVRQLRLLDNGLSIVGKQTDYKYVDEMLTEIMNKEKKLPSGTKELIQKQAESLKLSIENNKDLKMMKNTKEKIMGGAPPTGSNVHSILERLMALFYEKKQIFENSNAELTNFFLLINSTVSNKATEFVNSHVKWKSRITGNLHAPLARVVSDIEYNSKGDNPSLENSALSDYELPMKNHLDNMMKKVEDNAKNTLGAIGNSGDMALKLTTNPLYVEGVDEMTPSVPP